VEFNQDRVQQDRSKERRNKEIRRISGKLDNHRVRKLICSTGSKQAQYFPKKHLIIKKHGSAGDPIDLEKEDTKF
jgi:hypothetical protein